MRQTFTVQYYCRASKANKAGLAPIECSIIINGERTIFNLPRKESPKTFSQKHRPQELEDFLSLQHREIYTAQNFLIDHHLEVTPENIKKYLRGEIKEERNTVDNLCTKWDNYNKSRIGIEITDDVYRKYQRVSQMIVNTFGADTMLDTLRPGDMQKLVITIKSQYKTSTSAGMLTKLKAWHSYGRQEGNIMTDLWGRTKIQKAKPEIIFLTAQEIERIRDHKWECERLQRVADLCVFQANTGLSYVDLAELKPEDMKEKEGVWYIQKSRHKTEITFTSVVLPDGVKIWNKYQGHLPMLKNQNYNAYLKEIQDLCGIDKTLRTHIFRKTYASYLLYIGVPIDVISKTLGHSSSRITQAAYADLLTLDICNVVYSKLG